MKLFITKIFVILTFVYLLSFFSAGEVKASAPDVLGRVVTSAGAPVSGVWVRWDTSTDGLNSDYGSYRHAQTDSNGNFIFIDAYDLTDQERADQLITRIDSNLDGLDDTYLAHIIIWGVSGIWGPVTGFNCGDNPQGFTMVTPVGMAGSSNQINGIVINNGAATIDLNDIIFTSSASTPTPTPTPTPAYTIRGNVFTDSNSNKIKDNGEANYGAGTGVAMSGSASRTTTSDSLGNYIFSGLFAGTYSVTLTLPSGHKNTTPITQSITFP